MTILIDTHLSSDYPDELGQLKDRFPQHNWLSKGTEAQAYSSGADQSLDLADVEIYVGGPLTPEQYEKATKLRLHILPYTGVNQFPLDYLRQRGIILANNHGNAESVAERAVALTLAAAGRIVEFHGDLARGRWHRNAAPAPVFDLWKSLIGARIGIVGAGAIAQAYARLLSGFSPEITCFRRRTELGPPPGIRSVSSSLDELLHGKDVLLLALPATPATKGLLGKRELEIAAGAILVNVSRADIVEEEALFRALASRTLAGAGIDVWYQYPEPAHEPARPSKFDFESLSNLVMSPHAASHSIRGKIGQWQHCLGQLEEYLLTGELSQTVDLQAGY